jgi:hypothetical protein
MQSTEVHFLLNSELTRIINEAMCMKKYLSVKESLSKLGYEISITGTV